MAFSMLCWTRRCKAGWALVCALLLSAPAWTATATVSLQRDADGLYLSAATNWQPAPAVLDALERGVAMTFTMQATVTKPRWYWFNTPVQTTTRVKRLAYQPLTRQWRISFSTGVNAVAGSGVALHQNVDDLDTALALITRAKHWRIASANALDEAADNPADLRVRYTFALDLSALPRPFQIGVNDNPDWQLSVDSVHSVPAMAHVSSPAGEAVTAPADVPAKVPVEVRVEVLPESPPNVPAEAPPDTAVDEPATKPLAQEVSQ